MLCCNRKTYVNTTCWRKSMSEQKPPRSTKREARKRSVSNSTQDQMPANRSSKATTSQRVFKHRQRRPFQFLKLMKLSCHKLYRFYHLALPFSPIFSAINLTASVKLTPFPLDGSKQ